jgi:hypothetical protein
MECISSLGRGVRLANVILLCYFKAEVAQRKKPAFGLAVVASE